MVDLPLANGNNGNEAKSLLDVSENRPSECVRKSNGRFHLVRSRGKTIGGNGSFGYRNGEERFLYLEEVLFLFDRGLLTVVDEDSNKVLGMSELYALPPSYDLPLPVLLVYQHLRQQTFCTVRHSPTRLSIIKRIDERLLEINQSNRNNRIMSSDQQLALMRSQLRKEEMQSCSPGLQRLAFDCYNPGTPYSSSCPRIPDFSVAVSYYNAKTWGFDDLQDLIKEASTVVKIALVSDSGTVLVIGMTELGVPLIAK
jgi:hypothetical protein